jgi:selenophosphate synthase
LKALHGHYPATKHSLSRWPEKLEANRILKTMETLGDPNLKNAHYLSKTHININLDVQGFGRFG